MLERLDWIIIAIYVLGMLGVGYYFSRRTKSEEDYMFGGRTMNPLAVGLSLFASLLSVISYMMYPGEMIKNGPMFWCALIAYPFIFVVVGWFLIPAIMKQRVTSAYELLEVKLGPSVRVLAALLFLIMRFLWMAVIIYVCAQKIVIPIMGWGEDAALWISIVMGIITIIYTSMGGLRAVIATDVTQTIILFGAAIFSMILINNKLGGISGWWPKEWPDSWEKFTFYDTSARISFLPACFSWFGWYICTYGSDQMAIQRYLATKDLKGGRGVLTASLVVGSASMILLGVLGMGLFAYFTAHSSLLGAGGSIAESADKLFSLFIASCLPPGVTGLVIAGLMAAAMSSLSSGINSSSLVLSNDFVERFSKKELTELQRVRLARFFSFAIGVAVVLMSLVVGKVKGNLFELSFKVINSFVAPLFVPFFMAIFVRRSTEWGTFIGTVVSVLVACAISFWPDITGTQGLSFLWIIPCSLAAGVILSWVLSFVPIGGKSEIKK